jgi:hypothetical protein
MNRIVPEPVDLFDPRRSIFQASELAMAAPFTTTTSGTTGASVSFTTVFGTLGVQSNRYGIATLETGTNSTGRANIISPVSDQIVPGFGRLSFTAVIRTPSNLSDATNRYGIKVGFGTVTTAVTDGAGVHFRYRDNINSGKWQGYTVDYTGLPTQTDLGITVAASTWYTLEAFVNADATKTVYVINGTPAATVDLALQSGATVYAGMNAMILKSAGTTSRSMHMDYLDFRQEVTR